MAQLANETTVTLNGEYSYKVYANGGTAKLQMRDEGQAWKDVPDTAVFADAAKTIKFSGNVQAVLTGAAAVYLSKIS